MFTGLIEELGTIRAIKKSTKSASIAIAAKKVLEDVKIGDSICTNGVCLTVTQFDSVGFTVDVMSETMGKSNLAFLSIGDQVHLERALRVGDRLGGHMVSGHVDGLGQIMAFKSDENAVWISISASKSILKYVINKGSIAIDGISLTVAYVDEIIFKVSVIPHTKAVTTLLDKKVGDHVNLECDMVGKYIEKLMGYENIESGKKNMDMTFLSEHGFA